MTYFITNSRLLCRLECRSSSRVHRIDRKVFDGRIFSTLAFGVFVLGLITASALPAQVRFLRPTKNVDVANYRNVDECLAAFNRVKDSVERASHFFLDTAAVTSAEFLSPHGPLLVETARTCAARMPASSISADDYTYGLRLFLLAGRDADSIVQRHTAALQIGIARDAAIDTATMEYLETRPVRFQAADSLLELLQQRGSSVPVMSQLERNYTLLTLAMQASDAHYVRRAGTRIVSIAGRMTEAERRTIEFGRRGPMIIRQATYELNRAQLLDSLRRSTASYAAMQRATWAAITGERSDAYPIPIGVIAPQVPGDYWSRSTHSSGAQALASNTLSSQTSVPETLSSQTHPVRGKVAIVLFLGQQCREMVAGVDIGSPRLHHRVNCLGTYAALRRLSSRFPEIDVTILAQTFGFFSAMAPPPPEQEAEMFRRWLLDFHKLSGTLAVTNTPFFLMTAPDLRRINRRGTYETLYGFGSGQTHIDPTVAFLIDQDGLIVHTEHLNRKSEKAFMDLAGILFARSGGKS